MPIQPEQNPTRTILKRLEGGDCRSIGRSDEVVSEVLAKPVLFGDLAFGLAQEDPVVRMRCADAMEKITAIHPEYLLPYKHELIETWSLITQKEVRWHVAAMLSRLPLKTVERQRVIGILLSYTNDHSSIVKTLAMQALADIAMRDKKLQPLVRRHIGELSITGTPAMRARGRHLQQSLDAAKKTGWVPGKPVTPFKLEDIPNIGKSIASDLRKIGILHPEQLGKLDPLATYHALSEHMAHRSDPCVLYTLMAARHFMECGESAPWWNFTEQGKKLLAAQAKNTRTS
jgi:predicted flap endonuclease-1-like 5' DNA nuclease